MAGWYSPASSAVKDKKMDRGVSLTLKNTKCLYSNKVRSHKVANIEHFKKPTKAVAVR